MSAPVDVLAVMKVSERLLANSDFPGAVAYVNRVTDAREATESLIDALAQIERLSRTADPSLVNVPAMLGDIARAALARCGGVK
jgi:predicted Zn-ribbon and HTH transcriptional regulator